ncbi:hypothetical protein ECH_0971 [Ehrlichia chaffeensis str. Arkansas]|uniref:Uncharacterized protein n=1 Tax=Ehrlichia chaffeensis (strain ATCC CRL-10679 / Arkansas) TaxID=205920 RepID=Q2GFM5_EHRCR|nr:hypothetical protein ECH_0971 [Ehrlichia chaffeensis str. Arkansas]
MQVFLVLLLVFYGNVFQLTSLKASADTVLLFHLLIQFYLSLKAFSKVLVIGVNR